MIARQLITGLTLCIVLAPASFGFNLKFLDDSAISRFNEKDVEIMLDTLDRALENEDDGVEVKWENPKTGHHGSITPLNSKTVDGLGCRDADIRNIAEGFTGRSIRLLCKDKDGKWKAVQTN